MTDSTLPVAGTSESLQTFKNSVNGVQVHSEAVTPTDQTGVPFTAANPLPVSGTVEVGATSLAALELVGVKGSDGSTVASAANPLPVTDAALGSPADAAATTDTGTFSLIALFKRWFKKGQQTSANSLAVALSSEQEAIAAAHRDAAKSEGYMLSHEMGGNPNPVFREDLRGFNFNIGGSSVGNPSASRVIDSRTGLPVYRVSTTAVSGGTRLVIYSQAFPVSVGIKVKATARVRLLTGAATRAVVQVESRDGAGTPVGYMDGDPYTVTSGPYALNTAPTLALSANKQMPSTATHAIVNVYVDIPVGAAAGDIFQLEELRYWIDGVEQRLDEISAKLPATIGQKNNALALGVAVSVEQEAMLLRSQILDPGNSAYITSGGATFTGAWFATRTRGVQENITILTAFTIATGLPISNLTFTFTFQGSDDGTNVTVNVPVTLPAFETLRLLHTTDWLSNQWEYYRVIMTPSRALVAGEAISISTRHSMLAGNKFLYPMTYKAVRTAQVGTIGRSISSAFRQDETLVNTRASGTSDANSSTTNIPTGAGNGFIGSAYIDMETLAGFYISFLSNQVCTIYVDNSIDGITIDRTSTFTTVANVHFSKQLSKIARYAKIRVDNAGAGTTTTFRLQTGVAAVQANLTTGRLDEALSDGSIALNTHATISAREPAGVHSNVGKGLLGGLDVGIVEHEVATPILKFDSVTGGASNSVDTAGVQICTSPPSDTQAVLIQSDPDNGNVVIYLSGALATATNGAAMHGLGTAGSVVFPVGSGQTYYARTSTGSGKTVRWVFLKRATPA